MRVRGVESGCPGGEGGSGVGGQPGPHFLILFGAWPKRMPVWQDTP
jgi:hypothetical protein